ncbi:hypothetical protein GCM10028806_19620 [Spirosoma terrae]|uniref:Uncharacterized protein n=1 Tax=Spirosoma terrae TaxID=1968276 RepID=A0A6L9L6E8_9BACT|nr:hypothetical protein [Spirosoma terrae]NDU94721.1 hypothetical protein [Spirosoma terrae]
MPKTFTLINQAGPVVAPVAAKSVLINTSDSNLLVTNEEIDEAIKNLPFSAKNAVLNALYAVKPGSSLSLTAGTHTVAFVSSVGTAVLLVDKK